MSNHRIIWPVWYNGHSTGLESWIQMSMQPRSSLGNLGAVILSLIYQNGGGENQVSCLEFLGGRAG